MKSNHFNTPIYGVSSGLFNLLPPHLVFFCIRFFFFWKMPSSRSLSRRGTACRARFISLPVSEGSTSYSNQCAQVRMFLSFFSFCKTPSSHTISRRGTACCARFISSSTSSPALFWLIKPLLTGLISYCLPGSNLKTNPKYGGSHDFSAHFSHIWGVLPIDYFFSHMSPRSGLYLAPGSLSLPYHNPNQGENSFRCFFVFLRVYSWRNLFPRCISEAA
jgi:hypothetical protein